MAEATEAPKSREGLAFSKFEMISTLESKIRIIIGSLILFVSLFSFVGTVFGYFNSLSISSGFWSIFFGAGIMLIRMGKQSQ